MQTINQTSPLRNPVVASLLAAFCGVLWGSAYPGIKSGYLLFSVGVEDTAMKLVFAGYRFLLAGLLVLGGRWLTRLMKQWKYRDTDSSRISIGFEGFFRILILGLLQSGLHYYFFYVGISYTTGAKGSILNSVSVFFSAILAHLFYRDDKISLRKSLGLLLGFAGVVLVNYSAEIGLDFTFRGEGFIVIAALIFSLMSLYSKRITVKVDPTLVAGGHLSIGGASLIVTGMSMGSPLLVGGFDAYLVLVYLAVLSALAFTIWATLLKYHKVSSISIYNFVIPLSGTVLSALILKESVWQLQYYIALPAVAIGIYLVNSVSGNTVAQKKAG